jgi:hypothetical protein
MEKKSILFLAILLNTIVVKSQDIIIKTNGDEIKTKVILIDLGIIQYKKFENLDGPLYNISKSDVFMIKYENGTKDVFGPNSIFNFGRSRNKNAAVEFKKRGYISTLETNLGPLSIGSRSGFSMAVYNVHGYQFNDHFSLGAGFGLHYLDEMYIPLTIDARVFLLKGKIRPTINFNVGYDFKTRNSDGKGAFFTNPTIGVKRYISEKVALLFSAGYLLHINKVSYNTYQGWTLVPVTRYDVYQIMTLNVGFSF